MRTSLLPYFVTLGKKFVLSPFLIALVENPPTYPWNSKTQNKKVTGTATVLTIIVMLQQYKNSDTVAQITSLIKVGLILY